MRFKLLKIIIVIVLLSVSYNIWGQEKSNSINIGGIAAHFIGNESYGSIRDYPDYYSFPIDFGVEAIYLRSIPFNFKIGIGFNYQKGRFASHISGLRRFQFYELSVPVIIKKEFMFNNSSSWYFTAGAYFGKMTLQGVQMNDSAGNWHEWRDLNRLEGYSNDIKFADLYFDTGYSYRIKENSIISFTPFIKYRVNTIWLNTHLEKLHYGVKLIYTFNF